MALEICRICGSNENLKHVFNGGKEELADQIRLCTNVQIDELDCLPKFVCSLCEQGLEFSYRLRKQGEETDKKLRQELLGSEEIENYCGLDGPEEEHLDEALIEESSDDQLWLDKDSGHFDEQESLIEQVEEIDEEILRDVPEDSYDEAEQWITIQSFAENDEIITETETDKVDLIELICVGNDSADVTEVTETQTLESRKPKETQLDCETCGEVFDIRSKYSEHIKLHGDKRFHCILCDKWFSARYRFDQHMRNHWSDKGAYPCPKCPKSYTIQCNLERHIRSAHNGEKRFQCFKCGSSFGRADILKMHMAKHSTERNIECELCQKRFKTTQHLHYHKKSHLEKSERPKRPVRIGPKPKPKVQVYMCDTCDKISHHRTTHLNHMRTHTGEKPFNCSMCEKSFRTTHARTNHMLVHTDQRPHQCKSCGMSFRQTAHLRSHMLIHSGVKKHVCMFCQKAFTMKSNLLVHQRMHTGETPYECNLCPERFYQLCQLKRHQATHKRGNESQNGDCDRNATEITNNLDEIQIDSLIDEIIEINPNGGDSIVMTDCLVDEC